MHRHFNIFLDSDSDADIPLIEIAERELNNSLTRLNTLLSSKYRLIRSIDDLAKPRLQSIKIHGTESDVRVGLLTVAEIKSLVGANAIRDSEWYVTDAVLDYYSSILMIRCSRDGRKVCVLSAQFGQGSKIT